MRAVPLCQDTWVAEHGVIVVYHLFLAQFSSVSDLKTYDGSKTVPS